MPYNTEVLADSPIAYLRLNEVSGTVAADSSGNGNNGTYVGSPTLGVTGLIATDTDTAIQTAGSQQVTVPYTPTTNTFSLEMWWKWTTDGTADGIFRDNTSAGGTGYFISVSTTGVTVRIAGTNRFNTSTNYRDGIRHHFVLTYDGTTATLYIDGSQVDQWARASATLPATPLHIGFNGTNSGQYQPGVYDEFALYNYILTPVRVSTHYTAAGANPSDARAETLYLEAMVAGGMTAQVETSYVEAMAAGSVGTQVEATYLETMASGSRYAQVEANYIEAMTMVQPAQVSSVYTEAALTSTPPVQTESVYTEVMLTQAAPIQVESVYLEVLLIPLPGTPFKGWGTPI